MSGVLDDGDDVGAASGHVDEITAGTVGELDSVDCASRSDNIGNVGDGRARGSTEVKDLGTRLHVDGLETAEDTSSQLGAERVPDAVFGLGSCCSAVLVLAAGALDSNTLLAVDRLARSQVGSSKKILLAATSDEDTGVAMGFLS
jgi:hypothetical protein